jgi:hypothetical protein
MSVYRTFRTQSLDRQRQLALAHHCRLAFETTHPRFAWIEGGHGVILTVNSGYE